MFSVIGSIISPNPLAIQQFCTAFAFDAAKLGATITMLTEHPETDYLPKDHTIVEIEAIFSGGQEEALASYILRAKSTMPEYVSYVIDFPHKLQDDPGFVYVMWAKGSGKVEGKARFKIGFSAKPKQRVRQVNKNQPPYPVELVWTAETFNMPASEKFLHQVFAPHRRHNEWFELDYDSLSILEAIEFKNKRN